MKVAIYTLGCKVNQYETQAIEAELKRRGHSLGDFDQSADAYIINTCTVTAVSDHKSRQAIRRCRKHNPDSVVGVCGCYAQTDPEAVSALGVDLVAGTDGRLAFLDRLEQLHAARSPQPLVTVGNIMDCRDFEELPAGGLEGRTRAMLKVEDGCANFCTYCIIPYARGPVRSLPLDRAVAEARHLAEEGYRELVVTGIEISSWGRDLPGKPTLIQLLESICQAVPACRIRLGSLEPRTITEDFCRRATALPNLCGHFHLSMQSGCDATLRRMHRRYDTARFLKSVTLLRQYYDAPGITTDLIAGFPGETEEEFAATLDFLRACAFTSMHIFPYSIRPGTPAADMPGQVPKAVKEERAHRAAAVAEGLRDAYLASLTGKVLPVLFEEVKDGLWRGHAPNYVEVRMADGADLHNQVVEVTVTGAQGDRLLARRS